LRGGRNQSPSALYRGDDSLELRNSGSSCRKGQLSGGRANEGSLRKIKKGADGGRVHKGREGYALESAFSYLKGKD